MKNKIEKTIGILGTLNKKKTTQFIQLSMINPVSSTNFQTAEKTTPLHYTKVVRKQILLNDVIFGLANVLKHNALMNNCRELQVIINQNHEQRLILRLCDFIRYRKNLNLIKRIFDNFEVNHILGEISSETENQYLAAEFHSNNLMLISGWNFAKCKIDELCLQYQDLRNQELKQLLNQIFM